MFGYFKIKTSSRLFPVALMLSIAIHTLVLTQMPDFYTPSFFTVELPLNDRLKPSPGDIPQPSQQNTVNPQQAINSPAISNQPEALEHQIGTPAVVSSHASSSPAFVSEGTATYQGQDLSGALGMGKKLGAAEGHGIATRAGQSGNTLPYSVGAGTEFNSVKDYYQMVWTRIESMKQYPQSARQQSKEGRVTVYFVIERDGGVADIKILKASRFRILDEAAIDTIKRCVPFPTPPSDYFHASLPFQITIVFELT